MATVITVHGTYAHSPGAPSPAPSPGGPTTSAPPPLSPTDLQWWQPASAFEQDVRELVDGAPGMGSGKVEVTRFEWSGENSETARREAGSRLLLDLRALEARKEPYCLVGHSHGGSVIGWALLESAARRDKLDGLKRWITVGTPFVSLQKEHSLFSRLDLMRKVFFVASLMLLFMFVVYLAADTFSGGRRLIGNTFPLVLVITGTMMSLPILVMYVVLKYLDSRSLLHYRRAVKARAGEMFGPRWLPLTHTDDEAVQGLAFLPGAKLSFFNPSFAAPALTMVSVFALPLIYLLVLTSPVIMTSVGDWLKSNVYDANPHPEAERALRDLRQQVGQQRQQRVPGQSGSRPIERSATPGGGDRSQRWVEYREMRRSLEDKYPDLRVAERSLRFKQRFFEEGGKPCADGKLCGGGHDLRVNSALLLHVVTDELSAAIGGEGVGHRWERSIWGLVLAAVLVPLIFGLIALLLMLLIRWIAEGVSHLASKLLNNITNAEVKRAAFGNDTEGEIAVGAVDRPNWIERSPPRLPAQLCELVTAYSNGIANNSLAKFRRAIGQLASQEPKHTADSAITTYFTWKELVHASYFDVPEFRRLVAQAVSRADGFSASARFRSEADYARTAQWLAEIEGTPPTTAKPGAQPPTQEDVGAVSAVVASTVKAEP